MKASLTVTTRMSLRDVKAKLAFRLGIDPFYIDRTEVIKCIFSKTHFLVYVKETPFSFRKGKGWDKVEERLALFNEQLTGELQWFHGRKPQL